MIPGNPNPCSAGYPIPVKWVDIWNFPLPDVFSKQMATVSIRIEPDSEGCLCRIAPGYGKQRPESITDPLMLILTEISGWEKGTNGYNPIRVSYPRLSSRSAKIEKESAGLVYVRLIHGITSDFFLMKWDFLRYLHKLSVFRNIWSPVEICSQVKNADPLRVLPLNTKIRIRISIWAPPLSAFTTSSIQDSGKGWRHLLVHVDDQFTWGTLITWCQPLIHQVVFSKIWPDSTMIGVNCSWIYSIIFISYTEINFSFQDLAGNSGNRFFGISGSFSSLLHHRFLYLAIHSFHLYSSHVPLGYPWRPFTVSSRWIFLFIDIKSLYEGKISDRSDPCSIHSYLVSRWVSFWLHLVRLYWWISPWISIAWVCSGFIKWFFSILFACLSITTQP